MAKSVGDAIQYGKANDNGTVTYLNALVLRAEREQDQTIDLVYVDAQGVVQTVKDVPHYSGRLKEAEKARPAIQVRQAGDLWR